MLVKGAVAIITGGSRGLGKGFSEALLSRGCKVCLSGVNENHGRVTEKEFKERFGSKSALFVKCDVTKEDEFKELFRIAKRHFNGVNLVVNNAGKLDENVWETSVDVNLGGTIRGTLLAVEHMRKDTGGRGGLIINIASTSGVYPACYMPVYSASKFGIVGLTRSWAENPQRTSMEISFACLCPGFCDTDMFHDGCNPDKQLLVPFEETRDVLAKLIEKTGVNSVESVVKTFMELIDKDDCNGDVVTVDTLRGTKYHFIRKVDTQ